MKMKYSGEKLLWLFILKKFRKIDGPKKILKWKPPEKEKATTKKLVGQCGRVNV